MKQLTQKQILELATKDSARLKTEIRYCMSDWLKANAAKVVSIEAGYTNKTHFGEFPKGWKSEMKRWAKEDAVRILTEAFIKDKCFVLDGATWLGDWQMINEIAA